MEKIKLLALAFLFPFFIPASFSACNSAPKKDVATETSTSTIESDSVKHAATVTQPRPLPEKGIIHPALPTQNDPSVKYALYIPAACDSGTRWPVLFLFDPQGQGSMVLKKYQTLADQHKIVMLCSNTSKNGNTQDQSSYIIRQLFSEAFQLMPVDSNRVYFGGFSGGGRVASSALAIENTIKGIISIAAGTPPVNKNTCRFIGIVGKQDFNYKEVKTAIEKLTMPSMVLYHNGIHEWCPSEQMDKALMLLECDAMRAQKHTINKSTLQTLAAIHKLNAEKFQKSGNYTDAYNSLYYASECIKDLVTDEELNNAINNLKNSDKYKQRVQEENKLNEDQTSLVQFYVKQFGQPIDNWKLNMQQLNNEMSKSKNTPRYFMLQRLVATLSMQCYLYTKPELSSADLSKATYLTQLYNIIDPENKDAHYFAAILAARQQQQELMITELNISIAKGFSDVELLKGESAFLPYQNSPDFKKITEKATLNHNK